MKEWVVRGGMLRIDEKWACCQLAQWISRLIVRLCTSVLLNSLLLVRLFKSLKLELKQMLLLLCMWYCFKKITLILCMIRNKFRILKKYKNKDYLLAYYLEITIFYYISFQFLLFILVIQRLQAHSWIFGKHRELEL